MLRVILAPQRRVGDKAFDFAIKRRGLPCSGACNADCRPQVLKDELQHARDREQTDDEDDRDDPQQYFHVFPLD
jgi:hypothetical protein